jgi:hypothetical protein
MLFLLAGLLFFFLSLFMLLWRIKINYYQYLMDTMTNKNPYIENKEAVNSVAEDRFVTEASSLINRTRVGYSDFTQKIVQRLEWKIFYRFIKILFSVIKFMYQRLLDLLGYIVKISRPIKEEEFEENDNQVYESVHEEQTSSKLPETHRIIDEVLPEEVAKKHTAMHTSKEDFIDKIKNIEDRLKMTSTKENGEEVDKYETNGIYTFDLNNEIGYQDAQGKKAKSKDSIDEETRLINRMQMERGYEKFETALELGDLYARIGKIDYQKEIYLWIMRCADNDMRYIAAKKLIAIK